MFIDQYPYTKDVAKVRYYDGTTKYVYVDALRPAPLNAPKPLRLWEEPIKVEDRVRHKLDVAPEFRRLGGRVMSVNVTGRSVVVLWDGIGSYREELVSQLEVVHRAEKVEPTPMEQIVQLLDTEIDLLQERLKALNAAKAALPC